MKKIVLTFISLLITLLVVIIGTIMPSLSSTIWDNRLERENVLRQGDAIRLTFAKEELPTRLDSVAYFNCLDDYDRTIATEGLSLSVNHVKQIVFNFFSQTDCGPIFEYPLDNNSYDSWFPIIRPMEYSTSIQDAERSNAESQQQTRVFWYCFWQVSNGKSHVAWVDDLSKSIVAFNISLHESEIVENTKGNSGFTYIREIKIIDEFIEYFRDYCEADNAHYSASRFLLTLDQTTRADAWIINFELYEQSNGVTYNTTVQTVIYFSNGVFYFNTINPQIIIDEMNRM